MCVKKVKEKKTLITANLEKSLHKKGYVYIAGTDEVGTGALAAEVVASAVIFTSYPKILNLNDSKQLSHKQRLEILPLVRKHAKSIGIGVVSVAEVIKLNVYWAGNLAMKRAIELLDPQPDYVISDGNKKLDIDLPQQSIIKGDALCYSIAAASIVAKVSRDLRMIQYHEEFPQYHFDSNKGYRSPAHLEALREYGPCEIHRTQFIDVIRETERYNNGM